MSQALYRKYRSKSLDEIVGQSHITDMLRRAIASGRVSHAYLLTGPRGVGKTSIARILAHEINHLPYTDESSHLDIIEIDAASHTSVEDVRDLRDKVQIAPTSADKKVYIIDEVHMLSKSAFNALLKTLEEPPAHVIFILATTDADKLPATILSRVQRFNFRAISPEDTLAYIYAVLYAPGYRARYADFLKRDFPRIPLTTHRALFDALVGIGRELIALHVMDTVPPRITTFDVPGDNTVDKVRWAPDAEGATGRVYINAEQCFGKVPAAVWDMHIGGYRVAEKWLKDRKGRPLTYDDLTHYQSVISALARTQKLQADIDAAIDGAGGWPLT